MNFDSILPLDCPGPFPRIYRFRAECESDMHQVRMWLPIHEIVRLDTLRVDPFPDVTVELECRTWGLEDLRHAMRHIIEGGHVMRQTLNYASHYTGERNWDIA